MRQIDQQTALVIGATDGVDATMCLAVSSELDGATGSLFRRDDRVPRQRPGLRRRCPPAPVAAQRDPGRDGARRGNHSRWLERNMNITAIGRGNVGGGLARRWEKAGHTVTQLGRDGGDGCRPVTCLCRRTAPGR